MFSHHEKNKKRATTRTKAPGEEEAPSEGVPEGEQPVPELVGDDETLHEEGDRAAHQPHEEEADHGSHTQSHLLAIH